MHEAGHFFAATWQGIRVSSFSIGLGPVLLEYKRRGVQFALRAIPLGGFVALPDDDDDHQQITADALLETLELPYRRIDLCTGDMGFSGSVRLPAALAPYFGSDTISNILKPT